MEINLTYIFSLGTSCKLTLPGKNTRKKLEEKMKYLFLLLSIIVNIRLNCQENINLIKKLKAELNVSNSFEDLKYFYGISDVSINGKLDSIFAKKNHPDPIIINQICQEIRIKCNYSDFTELKIILSIYDSLFRLDWNRDISGQYRNLHGSENVLQNLIKNLFVIQLKELYPETNKQYEFLKYAYHLQIYNKIYKNDSALIKLSMGNTYYSLIESFKDYGNYYSFNKLDIKSILNENMETYEPFYVNDIVNSKGVAYDSLFLYDNQTNITLFSFFVDAGDYFNFNKSSRYKSAIFTNIDNFNCYNFSWITLGFQLDTIDVAFLEYLFKRDGIKKYCCDLNNLNWFSALTLTPNGKNIGLLFLIQEYYNKKNTKVKKLFYIELCKLVPSKSTIDFLKEILKKSKDMDILKMTKHVLLELYSNGNTYNYEMLKKNAKRIRYYY